MSAKLFTAEFWAYEAFLVAVFALLMASGVYRVRTLTGPRFVAFVFCTFSYIACIGIAAGHEWLRDKAIAYVAVLKKPARPAHLAADWGAELSKENRQKYSTTLARLTFEQWGEVVNYFDAHGNRIPYVPSLSDHENRSKYLEGIRVMEDQAIYLLGMAIAWLLAPILGVAIGFTPVAGRFFQPKLKANVGS